jgi:hypothetical protein
VPLASWDDVELMEIRLRQDDGLGRERWLAAILVVPALLCAASADAERTVQSVRAEETAEGWAVELRFSTPLRYVRHSPRGAASIALIELQALGIDRGQATPLRGRESLRPFEGETGPPITEVAADRAASGGLVVEIRFRGEVSFEVSQGSDLRLLQVLLPRPAGGADSARATVLMTAAAEALASSDAERAVQLYSKVLALDAPELHPEAQEMLGVARERAGQRSHALAEYQVFLQRYPDDERAPRVEQRLQTLAMADAPVPERGRTVPDDRPGPEFDFHGNLSTYYSRAEVYLSDGMGSHVLDNSWISDLYLNGRMRTPDYEIEASAAGRMRLDFEDEDLGDDSRFNSFLVEATERRPGWWATVGRQRGGSGVTGRFDGARLGYQVTDQVDLQVLGGFPLKRYSSDSLDTDRFQVGGASKFLDVYSLFDAELYTNYQNDDDLTFRAAIGGELRHLRANRSIVASFDYDAYFNAVNIAMLLADVEVVERLHVNTLLEYRKSPILTLGNALIGQSANSISDLHDSFSASQMKDLAKDRTADATTFTLGSRYEIGDRFDLSGNWTASRLSSTSSSGGVRGTSSTDYEYTYYLQLAGRALLMDRGVTTAGVRIFDGDRYDSYMLQLNGRYPVAPNLALNPIIRVEYQDADDGLVRWVPRLRLDYTWKDLIFDLDAAFDLRRSVSGGSRPDEYGYSLLFGVRYDF